MPHDKNTHHAILDNLERLGPSMATPVIVNGRRLLMDAAITLIESLPAHSQVWQQDQRIFIRPDPFAAPARAATPYTADLVAALLARRARGERLWSRWKRWGWRMGIWPGR